MLRTFNWILLLVIALTCIIMPSHATTNSDVYIAAVLVVGALYKGKNDE